MERGSPVLLPPWTIRQHVYDWFRDYGEWPAPIHLHEFLAEEWRCPVEVAEYDTLNALRTGYIYGLPTVVAMRLGEAVGDWRDPLPTWDNGFRLAVDEKFFDTWNGKSGLGCE